MHTHLTLTLPTNIHTYIDGVDYDSSILSSAVFFAFADAARPTFPFSIPTTLDTDVEGSETFIMSIKLNDDPGNVIGNFFIPVSRSQATVVIQEAGGNERKDCIAL